MLDLIIIFSIYISFFFFFFWGNKDKHVDAGCLKQKKNNKKLGEMLGRHEKLGMIK